MDESHEAHGTTPQDDLGTPRTASGGGLPARKARWDEDTASLDEDEAARTGNPGGGGRGDDDDGSDEDDIPLEIYSSSGDDPDDEGPFFRLRPVNDRQLMIWLAFASVVLLLVLPLAIALVDRETGMALLNTTLPVFKELVIFLLGMLARPFLPRG